MHEFENSLLAYAETDVEGPFLKFKDVSLGVRRLARLKRDALRIGETCPNSLHNLSSYMHVHREFDDNFVPHTRSLSLLSNSLPVPCTSNASPVHARQGCTNSCS